MGATIIISGFDSSQKVPGYFAETVYGAGPITVGSIPLLCLVVGTKLSTGSATPDQDVNQVLGVTEADALYGAGGEITTMCYAALLEQGVLLYGAPNAEAGGAAAGTATITIATAASSTGSWQYYIDGYYISGSVANGDTAIVTATAIAAAINAVTRLSVTAANGGTAVVTLTAKSKGLRSNTHTLFQDITQMPTAQTSVISGGSAMTGGGVFFTGGSGNDSLTNVLTVTIAKQYDRTAFAQYDATNAAAVVAQANAKAGVLSGLLEHYVLATSTSLSAATTLATTSLNAQRVQLLWYLNSPAHPPVLAARFAAMRTSHEAVDPGASYDGAILTGSASFPIKGQFAPADNPTQATQQSALNNGVTPIKSVGGLPAIVRSITSHSLNGSSPDYRTLDTSDAYIPDYVRIGLGLIWTTEFVVANPRVEDDPPAGVKPPVAGVATPTKWTQRATQYLKTLESGSTQLPLLTDVDENPINSGYDSTARRIMSAVPVIPIATQHQIGVSVRQLTAA